MKQRLMTSAAALIVASLPAAPSFAEKLHVPIDYSTIQDAIDVAVDGDMVLVADGTHSGPGNRDMDFQGKAITVRSTNGAAACVIDIQGDPGDPHRAFHFHGGETADSIVEGFTIQNGFMNQGGAVLCENASSPLFQSCIFQQNTTSAVANGDGGGAVFATASSPAFNDCAFVENQAQTNGFGAGGGAIRSVAGSSVTLNSCCFISNEAGVVGAIVSVDADTTLNASNCDFIGNTANTANGGLGIAGAVVVGAEAGATFVGCRFLNNTATGGPIGAVFISAGTAAFTDCLFAGNAALGSGGAVAVENGDPHGTFTNCLFANNLAASGGGLWIDDGTATVTNCTFSGNIAANQGGALRVKDLGAVSVDNSILWDNSPDQIAIEIGGVLSMSYSDVEGSWAGTGNIDQDPLFMDPDGPDDDPDTWEDNDYRLGPGSPCIDAANNTAVPEGILTDLAGNPRFVDDPDTVDSGFGAPPIVDMGAYEYQIPCPADMDGDGVVNVFDLLQLLDAWGDCPDCPADLNGDDVVNVFDLLELLEAWGDC